MRKRGAKKNIVRACASIGLDVATESLYSFDRYGSNSNTHHQQNIKPAFYTLSVHILYCTLLKVIVIHCHCCYFFANIFVVVGMTTATTTTAAAIANHILKECLENTLFNEWSLRGIIFFVCVSVYVYVFVRAK